MVLVTQVVILPSLTFGGIPVSALTIPLTAIAIAFGGLFVYLTPATPTVSIGSACS